MTKIVRFRRWRIVRYATIFIATVFAFILLTNGINESSFRIAIRFTARSSCMPYLYSFLPLLPYVGLLQIQLLIGYYKTVAI